jgi:hypothetical protein
LYVARRGGAENTTTAMAITPTDAPTAAAAISVSAE